MWQCSSSLRCRCKGLSTLRMIIYTGWQGLGPFLQPEFTVALADITDRLSFNSILHLAFAEHNLTNDEEEAATWWHWNHEVLALCSQLTCIWTLERDDSWPFVHCQVKIWRHVGSSGGIFESAQHIDRVQRQPLWDWGLQCWGGSQSHIAGGQGIFGFKCLRLFKNNWKWAYHAGLWWQKQLLDLFESYEGMYLLMGFKNAFCYH